MDHLKIISNNPIANPKVYYSVTRTSHIQLPDFFAVDAGTADWKLEKGSLIPGFNLYPLDKAIDEARNSFVQQWLFFGLISEVFKDEDFELDLTKFCCSEDEDIERITTEPLIDLIEQWHKMEQSEPSDGYRRMMRTRRVIDHAKMFAGYFSVKDRGPGVNSDRTWPIDDDLAFSILVLGQTLSHAWDQIMAELEGTTSSRNQSDVYEDGWGSSKLVIERLKNNNWDDSTIETLQSFWNDNTIGLLLTLNFSESWLYSYTERKPYEVYHRPSCKRGCTGFGRQSDVCHVLEDGSIPLFKYDPDKKALDVIPMDKTFNKPYAIFSHVWSHGFGNPLRNELPLCQLEHFHELFLDMQRRSAALFRGKLRGKPELFWIDTLGIPVGSDDNTGRLRGKVIAQMHNIYKHAKYTIVLDRSLMRHDISLQDYTRMATLISLSEWTRRLWTLQESVLSKDLYFNFSDGLYQIDMLESRYRSAREQKHTSTPKLARIYHSLILEEERPRLSKSQRYHRDKTSYLVGSLWSAIRWRNSAQRRHETLALSIILGLDTEELHETHEPGYKGPLDKFMEIFLTLLLRLPGSAIPAGLIFLPGPHLKAKGYGWAPESWLLAKGRIYTDTLIEKYPPTRPLGEYGLEVQMSGFKLHELENHCDKLRDTDFFTFPVSVPTSSVEHEWYRIERIDQDEWPVLTDFRNGEAAIICSRTHVFGEKLIGLLVSITKHNQHDVITAYILCRILISRVLKIPTMIELEQNLTLAGSEASYFCFGQALPSTQFWQVDRFQSTKVSPAAPQVVSQAKSQTVPQAAPIITVPP